MTDNRLPALRIAIRLTLAAAAAAALSTPQTSIAQRADSASRGGAGRARELPLKPARTIRLTTDEGTWMSLDISPNGQSLVFDLAGDLYTSTGSPGTFSATTWNRAFRATPCRT
jgi:hypothetical protein